MNQEYLNRCIGHKVHLWTTNGYLMSGIITEVAETCIVLDVNGTEQMVYIHAISTVRKAD